MADECNQSNSWIESLTSFRIMNCLGHWTSLMQSFGFRMVGWIVFHIKITVKRLREILASSEITSFFLRKFALESLRLLQDTVRAMSGVSWFDGRMTWFNKHNLVAESLVTLVVYHIIHPVSSYIRNSTHVSLAYRIFGQFLSFCFTIHVHT